MVTCFLGTAF